MSKDQIVPEINQAMLAEIDDANDRIDDISWWDTPVFILFWLLISVVFLQFFSRYVLNSSISWTEEIARYLLIIVAFAGSIICARKNSQIYLDFFHLYISKNTSKWLYAAMDLVSIGFFGYMTWIGIALAKRMGTQRMVSIDVSRGYLFWAIVACLALTALVTLARLIKTLRA